MILYLNGSHVYFRHRTHACASKKGCYKILRRHKSVVSALLDTASYLTFFAILPAVKSYMSGRGNTRNHVRVAGV